MSFFHFSSADAQRYLRFCHSNSARVDTVLAGSYSDAVKSVSLYRTTKGPATPQSDFKG